MHSNCSDPCLSLLVAFAARPQTLFRTHRKQHACHCRDIIAQQQQLARDDIRCHRGGDRPRRRRRPRNARRQRPGPRPGPRGLRRPPAAEASGLWLLLRGSGPERYGERGGERTERELKSILLNFDDAGHSIRSSSPSSFSFSTSTPTLNNNKKTPTGEPVSPLARLNQPDPTKKGGRWASEFVWNTDWAGAMDAAEASKKARKAQLAAEEAESERRRLAGISPSSASGPGGLSLTRTMDLDRMDIDLTEYLVPKDKARRPTTEELLAPKAGRASRRFASSSRSSSPDSSSSANNDFTAAQKSFQADARRWTRGGKFSRKAASLQQQPAAEAEAMALEAEAEAAAFEVLKKELILWAVSAALGGSVAAAAFYGPEVAASYAVGAVFGTVYLRLLGRSVDSFAGGGIASAAGAAVGQQRLLLPLILALGFNRYELLFAEKLGHHAQLLPMLVGFFTYKAAVVGRQAATLLGELGDSVREGRGGNTRFGSGSEEE